MKHMKKGPDIPQPNGTGYPKFLIGIVIIICLIFAGTIFLLSTHHLEYKNITIKTHNPTLKQVVYSNGHPQEYEYELNPTLNISDTYNVTLKYRNTDIIYKTAPKIIKFEII